ncbi:MAG: FHA domain-containing protein [Acidimicrobiales bacterium]
MTGDGASTATAAALDTWPGVLHRGLGWVGRWPGLVAVIPNDPAHDMAAEQLLRQLGAGVTADEARAAISAAALRGELRAAAYVAQTGADPSALVGFACGVTEVIADGQVLINGTSPLQEVPLGNPEQLTVRAANLAAAARAVSPYDLRLGVVPGAGITLAPVGAAIAADPSTAGTGSALPGGSVHTGPQSITPGGGQPGPSPQPPPAGGPSGPPPAPGPVPISGGVAGSDPQRRPDPPAAVPTPAPPEVVPFVAVLLGPAPVSPPAAAPPLPTLTPVVAEPPSASPGPLGHPAPSHRIPTPDLPINADDVVVEGILCSRHHFNNPIASYCMVCGISMVHLTHNLVPGPRPTLGFIVFDNGSTYGLDRSYVVGREPGQIGEANVAPLAIHDDNETLSRRHAEIRLVGWDVHIVDLGSTNGTFVWDVSFERWNQIAPNTAVLLSPGDTVALGRRTFVFESVTRL